MLDWYTSLLTLRKKFIKDCEPGCEAKFIDGVIHMQIPCEEPTLKVFARIRGTAPLPELGGGWEKVLAEEEDGCAVSVWVESLDTR